MLAVALGLGSSICWGLADFLGGLQSRRVRVLAVLLVSQGTGLLAVAVVLLVAQPDVPSLNDLWPAAGAGLAGAIALSAFYRGLAIGTMSIVAPISSTGAAVPVIVGIATGDRPTALQAAGIAAAVVGVVLASRELASDQPATAAAARTSVLLALVAALGFGIFFVGMDAAADASVPCAMLAARIASVLGVLIVVAGLRVRLPESPRRLSAIALVGLLDVSANGLYAWGSTQGLLSVVAVLGALYPVSTVVLARAVLGERVRRVQELGIVLALTGVVLIAAG
jgi:drug/metabolite transporter (DMT)-like permease